ncbi:MAG: DUF2190 family protein [Burkholderiales bacterium]|jgi:hypothetical protein|nr:DUF2190 family protein [Burkholderiales bacterium]
MQRITLLTLSVIAAARIEAYCPINADGKASKDTDFPLGFTFASADAGESVGVDVIGTTIAYAGAALAPGDALKLSGGAVVPGGDETDTIGRALYAAAKGDKTEILLLPRAA